MVYKPSRSGELEKSVVYMLNYIYHVIYIYINYMLIWLLYDAIKQQKFLTYNDCIKFIFCSLETRHYNKMIVGVVHYSDEQ